MSEPIERPQLLALATEAYTVVQQAYVRDRQNCELAVKTCQAAAALSALMNDCTPPQTDPVAEVQLSLLQELADVFKSVKGQLDVSHADDIDGGMAFGVTVLEWGAQPELVQHVLSQAGVSGRDSFVTQQSVRVMSLVRELVAAGAAVQITVINPSAMDAEVATTSGEASGASGEATTGGEASGASGEATTGGEASGASGEATTGGEASGASDEASGAASDEAAVASDEAAVAFDDATDGGEE